MTLTIIPFLTTFMAFMLFQYLNKKFNFGSALFDDNFIKPQAFHENSVPRLGGTLLFLVFILPTFLLNELNILSFGIPFIFLIGLLDDTKVFTNPTLKLLSLILLLFIMTLQNNLKVTFTDLDYIDYLLSNYNWISIIFLIICLLTIINGANFIDGFNGLLLIHSIIICVILFLIQYLEDSQKINIQLIHFLSVLIAILFLNFPKAKLFLGDSGSYLIGILVSFFIINTHNMFANISPFFWTCLLFYLFFEVLFSFSRKILNKKNPLKPDRFHLHMIVYKILFKKIKIKYKSNYLTSILINLIYFVLLIPAFIYRENFTFSKIYFFSMIAFYIFTYLFLFKISKNYK